MKKIQITSGGGDFFWLTLYCTVSETAIFCNNSNFPIDDQILKIKFINKLQFGCGKRCIRCGDDKSWRWW